MFPAGAAAFLQRPVLKSQERERLVGKAGEGFVAEILIEQARFFGADGVVDGELRVGRADRGLEREGHQDLGADARSEVVDINVAERFKKSGAVFGEFR